ncbi:MAG: transglycosylase SLT domain-containing protein [Dissulfurimicrobium sp.]|uniref:lytic transglycosylase domain-containing protein n=1 Tax=Dissulfurimicrobium hydrothermale TaxID=1750598 RepID=UPI003C727301
MWRPNVISFIFTYCLTLFLISLLIKPVQASTNPDTSPISGLLHLYIPAKVEFCGETVPLNKEDVLERLDTELVVILGQQIDAVLWFKRSPRYFPMIERMTRRMGLPEDLKYVALIESNLRADAVSPAGATGPWQFMEATGESCNLKKTDCIDERRHWELATQAALTHLSELKASLGSWSLALAAYNAGPNRILKAMEEQGERDFYGLKLPRETERYVFRAIAAKLIMENPSAYGIDTKGIRLYEPECTDTASVTIQKGPIPVSVLAHGAGVSYRWFLKLNPWIIGNVIPRGTYNFTVPNGAVEGLKEAVSRWLPPVVDSSPKAKAKKRIERARIENNRARHGHSIHAVATHKVKKGDTLSSIAREYKITVNELCRWNGISNKKPLRPGQRLSIHRGG